MIIVEKVKWPTRYNLVRDRIVYNEIWDGTAPVQKSKVGNKVEEGGIEEAG